MTEADIEIGDLPHPRQTETLFGHADAEQVLLASYQSGRMPHAWLIGGQPGIGKATLAYRVARFILAHPDPRARDVQKATSLAVPEDHPASRRIANEAHPDLLVLERTLNDKGRLRTEIAVDDVRRSVSFFGSTAGEGGWRIAIVDAVDELNAAGANALLKLVEEPPPRSILFLVSHAPGRVMSTIRSRCRQLLLRPLSQNEVAYATAAALGLPSIDAATGAAAAASNGSVARAIELIDPDTVALRHRIVDLIAQLPDPDPRGLHALGDAIGGSDAAPLATFMDVVNGWLADRIETGPQGTAQLARVAKAWDEINGAAHDVEEYNLERKPLVFAVFGLLAEAARG
ncbi:MAG: DNA polymerase III subunit delta' [Pseudolabrys sp.]|nr:DNA polymerase III subunit delta' [Pseudolabrys sp.]